MQSLAAEAAVLKSALAAAPAAPAAAATARELVATEQLMAELDAQWRARLTAVEEGARLAREAVRAV